MDPQQLRVPPSLHEAEIERHHPRDPVTRELQPDPELRTLAEGMAGARRYAEQLAALAAALREDKSRPPEAAAVVLRRAALTLGEKGSRGLDAARARAGTALRQPEAKTAVSPPRLTRS